MKIILCQGDNRLEEYAQEIAFQWIEWGWKEI